MTSHIYGKELNYTLLSLLLPSLLFLLLLLFLCFSIFFLLHLGNSCFSKQTRILGSILTQGLSFPLSPDTNQDNNSNSTQTIINKKQTRTYRVILQKKKYISTVWGCFAYHHSTIQKISFLPLCG